MSSELAIKVERLQKTYEIYNSPLDRLKQFILFPFMQLFGKSTNRFSTRFEALSDVSFEVTKGQTVGIIGRNGSGKSTLLQLLCGTLEPSHGSIFCNGRIAALLELGAGFNPEFTGRENVYLNGTILGLGKFEIDERFEQIAEFADIGDFIEQPVKNYSSGMVIRLAFAVAAHVNADILIIDEALAVGDAFFVQKCMRFLREFMKKGTVLFVSHDTAAVLNLCDSALWLQDGKLVASGEPKEITERYLARVYESQQGHSINEDEVVPRSEDCDVSKRVDKRLDFINLTSLRNDIELFEFSKDGASFGKGMAKVTYAAITDKEGNACLWVVGGEEVVVKVHCLSYKVLERPIIGFQVKDRLGQVIFGENTYISYIDQPIKVEMNQSFYAKFEFMMPLLPVGDYTISIAIADGSQQEHVMHHWIQDAIAFKVHHTSVSHGLVGIPMHNIELTI